MKQFVTCEIPEGLLRMGQERRFLKGSNIFKAGESITHCYYIRSGVVNGTIRIVLQDDGC